MHGEAVVFELPKLPGCDAVEVEPLEVSPPDPIEVLDEGEKETKSKSSDKEDASDGDPWTTLDKKGPKHIVQWAQDMVKTLPRHSGKEILGVERVIACFDKMLRAISKCIQSDIRGEADIEAVEKVRNELLAGKRRLEKHREALEKMQSVAMDEKDGLVKKAQKTGNFVVCVPVPISSIARTAINSTVSAGKDLEKVVAQLIKEYELNKREQAELFQVLADNNLPVTRLRGYEFDAKIDKTSPDNFDWVQTNWPNYDTVRSFPSRSRLPKIAQDFGDFEPYVYEDDSSIGYYEDAMNSYMDEWEGAIWDDLKQEQKRLKDTAAEFSI